MTDSDTSIAAAANSLLKHWIREATTPAEYNWFEAALGRARDGDRPLFTAISLVTRKLGKTDLALDAEALSQAAAIRPGWHPQLWSVDQAARVSFLLASVVADTGAEQFAARLGQLCDTADMGELVAFYQGLPLYPAQPQYKARAAEGIRTNMRSVFEAVAHRNPYPSEQLEERPWNQMVLKAIFVGSTLHPVVGLDARANVDLTRMLCDYAQERWSAGRVVSPELWRCVALAADERALACLRRAMDGEDALGATGAALAIAGSDTDAVRVVLDEYAALKAKVINGATTWAQLLA